jgi:hypothetical protein
MSHPHDRHTPAAGHVPHLHGGEDYAARKHPEFVVLELGEDLGALIVHAGADMHGIEIEITPEDNHELRSHKQVLERSVDGRPAFTAVFDGLLAGSYALWRDGEPRAREVSVTGGSVAELDWPTAA